MCFCLRDKKRFMNICKQSFMFSAKGREKGFHIDRWRIKDHFPTKPKPVKLFEFLQYFSLLKKSIPECSSRRFLVNNVR